MTKYDEHLAVARQGCCDERPKPCVLHIAWADGYEAGEHAARSSLLPGDQGAVTTERPNPHKLRYAASILRDEECPALAQDVLSAADWIEAHPAPTDDLPPGVHRDPNLPEGEYLAVGATVRGLSDDEWKRRFLSGSKWLPRSNVRAMTDRSYVVRRNTERVFWHDAKGCTLASTGEEIIVVAHGDDGRRVWTRTGSCLADADGCVEVVPR
jgi:hypothetical protein